MNEPYLRIGRYVLFDELASGGMAKVHIGRLIGPVGFSRTVAVKRLHPGLARDRDFVSMFVDEARLAARVRHPNVVPIIDVVQSEEELFLIMEYVQGETLSRLLGAARREHKQVPIGITAAVIDGVLHGLHAAHEARGDSGEALNLVHRDVSPQNILVGVDGVARVLDFGIAKATGRIQHTAEGQVKGKLAYIAPEQLSGNEINRQADIYSAGVVLWEALAGRRMYSAETDVELFARVLEGKFGPPSEHRPGTPAALDAVVMKALARAPEDRWATARQFALAIEEAIGLTPAGAVGAWVEDTAMVALRKKEELLAGVESHPGLSRETPSVDDVISTPRPTAFSRATTDAPPESGANEEATLISSDAAKKGAAPPRRRRLMLVAALVAAGGLIAAVAFRGLDEKYEDASAPEAPTAPTASDTAAPESTDVETAQPPEPSTEFSVEPSASSPRPRWRPPRAKPVASSPPPATTGPAQPKAKESCDPPYSVDENGIQRLKPHCL